MKNIGVFIRFFEIKDLLSIIKVKEKGEFSENSPSLRASLVVFFAIFGGFYLFLMIARNCHFFIELYYRYNSLTNMVIQIVWLLTVLFVLLILNKKKEIGKDSFGLKEKFTFEKFSWTVRLYLTGIIPFLAVHYLLLYKEILNPEFHESDYSSIIGTIVIWPILEELVYRLCLLSSLLKRFTPVKAIMIDALLFTAVHIVFKESFYGIFAWFIGGIVFSLVFYKTRSILFAIIMHSLANSAVLFMSYLNNIFAAGPLA